MSWAHVQAFSQNAQFSGGGGASTAAALGSAVAIGDTILVYTTAGYDATASASTVTDSLGNTYVRLSAANGGRLLDSANSQTFDAWSCVVTVAGTPTITYTPNGSTSEPFIALKGDHFTGSDANSVVRASAGQIATNPGTGTDAIKANATTVASQSGDLLWCGCASAVSFAAAGGTGFTASTQDATSTIDTEWLTAAGAHAATWTDATNGGASVYGPIAIAITPAAAAAASAPAPMLFPAMHPTAKGLRGSIAMVIRALRVPVSSTATPVSATSVSATENAGAIAQALASSDENVGRVAQTAAAPDESTQGPIAQTAASPDESAGRVALATASPDENAGGVAGTAASPDESLGFVANTNWNRVQSFAVAATSGVGSIATTLAKAVAVGDVILLGTHTGATSSYSDSTVTDDLGNFYERLTSAQGGQRYNDNSDGRLVDAWWCTVTNAGTPTITYNPHSGANQSSMWLQGSHFNGASGPTSAWRDSKSNLWIAPGTGVDAIRSPFASAQAGDLSWGFVTQISAAGTPNTGLLAGPAFESAGQLASNSCLDEWTQRQFAGIAAADFTTTLNGNGDYVVIGILISPDVAAPDENVGAVVASLASADESLGRAAATIASPDENVGPVAQTALSPDENVGRVAGSTTSPDENSGLTAVTATQAVPSESLGGIAETAISPDESGIPAVVVPERLAGGAPRRRIRAAVLAATATTGTSVLRLRVSASLRADAAAQVTAELRERVSVAVASQGAARASVAVTALAPSDEDAILVAALQLLLD